MWRSESEIVEQPKSIPAGSTGVERAELVTDYRRRAWLVDFLAEALNVERRDIDRRRAPRDERRNAFAGERREEDSILPVSAGVEDARQIRISTNDRASVWCHGTQAGPCIPHRCVTETRDGSNGRAPKSIERGGCGRRVE